MANFTPQPTCPASVHVNAFQPGHGQPAATGGQSTGQWEGVGVSLYDGQAHMQHPSFPGATTPGQKPLTEFSSKSFHEQVDSTFRATGERNEAYMDRHEANKKLYALSSQLSDQIQQLQQKVEILQQRPDISQQELNEFITNERSFGALHQEYGKIVEENAANIKSRVETEQELSRAAGLALSATAYIRDLKTYVEKLNTQVAGLQDDKQGLSEEVRELQSRLTEAEDRCSALKATLEASDQKIDNLEKVIQQSELDREELQTRHDHLVKHSHDLTGKLQDLQNDKDSPEVQLQSHKKAYGEMSDWEKELAILSEAAAEPGDKCARKKDGNTELLSQAPGVKDESQKQQQVLESVGSQQTLPELEQQSAQGSSTIQNSGSETADLNRLQDSHEEDLPEIQAMKQHFTENLQRVQSENADLRNQLDLRDEKYCKNDKTIEDQMSIISDLDKVNAQYLGQLINFKDRADNITGEVQNLQNEVKMASQNSGEIKSQLVELSNSLDELRVKGEQLGDIKQLLEGIKGNFQEYEKRNEYLEERIQSVESQASELSRETSTALASYVQEERGGGDFRVSIRKEDHQGDAMHPEVSHLSSESPYMADMSQPALVSKSVSSHEGSLQEQIMDLTSGSGEDDPHIESQPHKASPGS